MADRQRSFADMYPDLLESMTRGAQWKESMRPRTKKEMARQLTQEDRKWLKEREQQEWLDRRLNLLGPQDPSIASQVLDYASMWPGNIARKGVQTGMWDMVPDKIKKRIKRQMKEAGETRKSVDDYQVGEGVYRLPTMEDLEKHEQVSDRMGYNPTDKRVGEPRSASDHAMGLAGRFLEFLRDKDARRAQGRRELEVHPMNPDLPPIRDEYERFAQSDRAMFNRNKALKEAASKMIESSKDRSFGGLDDLMGRVFGRRKSRDLPYTNR